MGVSCWFGLESEGAHDGEVRVDVGPVEVEEVLLRVAIWQRVLGFGDLKDLILRLELFVEHV